MKNSLNPPPIDAKNNTAVTTTNIIITTVTLLVFVSTLPAFPAELAPPLCTACQ